MRVKLGEAWGREGRQGDCELEASGLDTRRLRAESLSVCRLVGGDERTWRRLD